MKTSNIKSQQMANPSPGPTSSHQQTAHEASATKFNAFTKRRR